MARRRLTITLLALALTGGSAAAAIAAGALETGSGQAQPITLSGQVEGLAPAAGRNLVVRIANPNSAPLVVSSVVTDVTSPVDACPASALRVGDLRAPVTVPAGGAADGTVIATLAADAPDACQGVRFALTFKATGRGEGTLTPASPATPTTPATPGTPATTPETPVTPSTTKTTTKTVKKRVCRRRRVKVRVHGRTVRRWKRVCKTVKVKVTVPA